MNVSELVPLIRLADESGKPVNVWELQPRRNLVLVFLCGGRPSATRLVRELAERRLDVEEEETRVIAVLHGTPDQARAMKAELSAPFVFLADEDGEEHRRAGALSGDGSSGPALYIADRYAAVYSSARMLDGNALPSADEVLKSLRHINSMCDE